MNRFIAIVAIAVLTMVTACATTNGTAAEPAAPPEPDKKKNNASDPLHSLTYMRQGSVLMQQGRFEAALESFQQADKIAPGNATNKNMIGLCFLRMGQPDRALSSFDEALSIIPGFTDARNNRGATYLSLGQFHLAEVDFVAVLADSTYPHRRQVYYNLGITYLQRDQLGAAEENFRKSIAPPSPVFDGYIQLAQLAQRQGAPDRAKILLEEAKLEFPDSTEISFELGKLLMIMGNDDEARPYLERVLRDAPESHQAATARALLGQG